MKLLSTRNKFTAVVAVLLLLVFAFPALSAWREQLTIGELTVETSFTAPTGSVTSGEILDGTIVNDDINAAAEIAITKLGNGTDGQIAITSGTDVNWVTQSGDFAFNNTGLGNLALMNGIPVGAIDDTAGEIIVGDGDSLESVACSGDVTCTSAGAINVANDKIGNAELKASFVTVTITSGATGGSFTVTTGDVLSGNLIPISGFTDVTRDTVSSVYISGTSLVMNIIGPATGSLIYNAPLNGA